MLCTISLPRPFWNPHALHCQPAPPPFSPPSEKSRATSQQLQEIWWAEHENISRTKLMCQMEHRLRLARPRGWEVSITESHKESQVETIHAKR